MEPPILIGGVVAVALIFGSLIASYRSQKRRRLLEALPTSATQGVFIGLVEVKGTAESSQPLITYLAEAYAVHYTWSITESWERWETEYYTDKDGKRRSRRVRKSGWKTVASGGDSQPFYLQDDTGFLLVRPTGADVRGVSVFNRYCGRGDPLYYGKGPRRSISDSTHRRRFTETAIVLHEELYVVGKARERSDVVAAEIAAQEAAPLFLVTTETEEQVRGRLGTSAVLWTLGGTVAAGGVGWLVGHLISGQYGSETGPIIGACIGVGAYVSVTAVLRMILLYNSMIDTRNRMRQGFSQIDVQLSRRADLIPALTACVDGIAKHEREVQTQLAELRSEAQSTAPGKRGSDPQAVAPKLRIIVEKYPQLKTDQHFLKLQHQLVETEQRLALARGYFNDIASEWNNRVEQFPDSILAKMFGFRPQALFEASDFERAAVEVDFAESRAIAEISCTGYDSPPSAKMPLTESDLPYTTTDSGLQYRALSEGEGDKPTATNTVTVHYTGCFEDGETFDSSIQRGEPTTFPLGGVIAGWTEGVQLMSPGSKYQFIIPHKLAYGEAGAGGVIPPMATLHFEIELLEFQ